MERGAIDMSHGDPLFRLMKALTAWWKQRFRVTAPGIRKVGYMSLERLDRLTKTFRKEEHDPEWFGECIRDLDEFRRNAEELTGSRDTGAQLFTALLRALGLEARMIASLQPLGFGWNKLEEADPEKERGEPGTSPTKTGSKGQRQEGKVKTTGAAKNPVNLRAQRRPSRPDPEADAGESEDFELHADDSDSDAPVELPMDETKSGKT